MATLFSDPFTRADSASLGANWTEPEGNTNIVSNQARVVTGSGTMRNARTTTTAHAATADQKVSVTVRTEGCDGGPVVRSTGATHDQGYAIEAYSTGIDLLRIGVGGTTVIASGLGSGVAVGDVLRLEVQGSTLRVYKNGVQQGANQTDTTITAAGMAGFGDFANSCDYDDFLVEDFAAGGVLGSGTAAGVATLSLGLGRRRPIAGASAAGQATLTHGFGRRFGLGALSSTAAASSLGTLGRRIRLGAGSAAALATSAGTLGRRLLLGAGAVSALGTSAATLGRRVRLGVAQGTAVATATATLGARILLGAGTSTAAAASAATLGLRRLLGAATTAGIAAATSTLGRRFSLGTLASPASAVVSGVLAATAGARLLGAALAAGSATAMAVVGRRFALGASLGEGSAITGAVLGRRKLMQALVAASASVGLTLGRRLSITQAYERTVLADQPAAYWRLSEASGPTAADSVGANHGDYLGTPTYAVAGALAADANTAVRFNGGEMVRVADAAALKPSAAMTAEAWVRKTATSIYGRVLMKGYWDSPTPPQDYGITVNADGGYYTFIWRVVEGETGIHSAAVPLNEWHHIAFTYDGATLRGYLDGVEFGSPAAAGTIRQSTTPLGIGASWFVPTSAVQNPITAEIDEVALYPTALSAARIRAHHEAGRAYIHQTIPAGSASVSGPLWNLRLVGATLAAGAASAGASLWRRVGLLASSGGVATTVGGLWRRVGLVASATATASGSGTLGVLRALTQIQSAAQTVVQGFLRIVDRPARTLLRQAAVLLGAVEMRDAARVDATLATTSVSTTTVAPAARLDVAHQAATDVSLSVS